MSFTDITFGWLPFLAGLVAVFLLGFAVGPLIKCVTDVLKKKNGKSLWRTPELQGRTIGYFERMLFYLSIIFGYPVFIGAWLVFKVAAKWATWSHIVKLPELSDSNLNSDEFETRYRFSTWILSRFLIGTLANITIAIIASFLYLVIQYYVFAT